MLGRIVLVSLMAVTAVFASVDSEPRRLGSVGYYSDGSLDSDAQVTGNEVGLLKMFPERDRGYGNVRLIEMLTSLGLAYTEVFPGPFERLHVGDLSQKGGGRITRHASHQNGLDVDLGFFRRNFRESASFDEKFVENGRVTENFDGERNWWALKWLFTTARIDRIFVDREIKRFFCQKAEAFERDDIITRSEILRLLRPWPNHDDHFHVRLECPAADSKCVGSLPVAAGDGCDEKSLHENDSQGFEP